MSAKLVRLAGQLALSGWCAYRVMEATIGPPSAFAPALDLEAAVAVWPRRPLHMARARHPWVGAGRRAGRQVGRQAGSRADGRAGRAVEALTPVAE